MKERVNKYPRVDPHNDKQMVDENLRQPKSDFNPVWFQKIQQEKDLVQKIKLEFKKKKNSLNSKEIKEEILSCILKSLNIKFNIVLKPLKDGK